METFMRILSIIIFLSLLVLASMNDLDEDEEVEKKK